MKTVNNFFNMQNIFSKNRIKMVLVLLFTFFSVKTVAPNLFIANSPVVNPLFIANVINAPSRIAAMPGRFLSSLSNFKLLNFESPSVSVANIEVDPAEIAKVRQVIPPASVVFKEILKGVATGVNAETGEKYIKVKAGTKYRIVGTVTINGKQYPKIEFVE